MSRPLTGASGSSPDNDPQIGVGVIFLLIIVLSAPVSVPLLAAQYILDWYRERKERAK